LKSEIHTLPVVCHSQGGNLKKLQFKKIDAFATNISNGNPAGYIKLNNENELSIDEMLLIAKQLKGFVNEVGFVYKIKENTFNMKYYSSEREVDFCGHATIAIMYDLIKNDQNLWDESNIFIITNKGKLKIVNIIKDENSVYIYSPKPIFHNRVPNLIDICENLRIDNSFVSNKYPIELVNAGLNTLIISINGLDNLLKINPEESILKEFCLNNKIDIIEVFSDEVFNNKNDYRTRVFAPTFGYLEDPATGSGNSAFGYYLRKNNLWNSDKLVIEQNNDKVKYNIVNLRISKDEENENRVLFGGPAIIRIEGFYILP
jgi:PhzF family phenazine biosynthesis protein